MLYRSEKRDSSIHCALLTLQVFRNVLGFLYSACLPIFGISLSSLPKSAALLPKGHPKYTYFYIVFKQYLLIKMIYSISTVVYRFLLPFEVLPKSVLSFLGGIQNVPRRINIYRKRLRVFQVAPPRFLIYECPTVNSSFFSVDLLFSIPIWTFISLAWTFLFRLLLSYLNGFLGFFLTFNLLSPVQCICPRYF